MKVLFCIVAFLALVAYAYSCPEVDGEFATILRNKEDCGSFYICSNGTPYLFQCPAGLEFNSRLRVCDWPANARCRVWRPRPTTTTTTTRRPRPTWNPRPTTRRPNNKPRDLELEVKSESK